MMDWLPEGLLGELRDRHATVERHLATVDPETAPYASKYKAREGLREMADSLRDQINDTQVHASAIGAAIYADLGVIDMDVQVGGAAAGWPCLHPLDVFFSVPVQWYSVAIFGE